MVSNTALHPDLSMAHRYPAATSRLEVSVRAWAASANTTYYYKAYATDNAGTHYGSESSFTTASLTAPVATAATNNATTSLMLIGTP